MVEWNKRWSPLFPHLSCELLVSMKENLDGTELLKYQNNSLSRDVWFVEPNKMTVPEVQTPSCNFQKQSSF